MNDIETRVSEVLTRRAQRPVELERLRANAVRRATAMRRRRRVVGTALVTIAVLGVTGLFRTPAVTPPQNTLPQNTLPRSILPLETAAPPGGIGSDPGLLHFDVDLSVFEGAARSTEWVSGIGYEAVHIYRDDDRPWVDITLDPTEASRTTRLEAWLTSQLTDAGSDVLVAGRPGRLQEVIYSGRAAWLLRWQPAPDVFGAVIVADQDEGLAVAAAQSVRLDRVQRCVMPLRLLELPAQARWHECQTRLSLSPPGWVYSGLTLERAGAKPIFIWADGRRGADHAASFKADQMVAGYPAQWLTGGTTGTGLWIPDFGPIDLFITAVTPSDSDGLTPDDARWLAQRLRPSRDTGDPATWPRRAVG